jgi:hypothetical protein
MSDQTELWNTFIESFREAFDEDCIYHEYSGKNLIALFSRFCADTTTSVRIVCNPFRMIRSDICLKALFRVQEWIRLQPFVLAVDVFLQNEEYYQYTYIDIVFYKTQIHSKFLNELSRFRVSEKEVHGDISGYSFITLEKIMEANRERFS